MTVTHDHAAVVLALGPGDQTVLLQLAHLATGRRRVHLRDPGQLSHREVPVLLEPSQEEVALLGDHHAGGRRATGVHLATGVEAEELLEGTFDGCEFVTRAVVGSGRHAGTLD